MSDYKKILSNSFIENHKDIDEGTAIQLIVEAEQKIKEIEQERSADEKLATAKQVVKDLNAAYKDAIKHERAKINFFLERINQLNSGSPHT